MTVAQRLIVKAVAVLDPSDIPGFIRSLYTLLRGRPGSVLCRRPLGGQGATAPAGSAPASL